MQGWTLDDVEALYPDEYVDVVEWVEEWARAQRRSRHG
jgi:hypothetical protein